MKQIELKITGVLDKIPEVTIDDQVMKFKKNGFGNLICIANTENERVCIRVKNYLDVGGVGWFLFQIFLFLISIFGLFDIHKKERCFRISFEANVLLKEENKIALQLTSPKESGKAIHIQTNLVNEEVVNEYYIDDQARRKLKILKWVKILLTILILVSIAVGCIMNI